MNSRKLLHSVVMIIMLVMSITFNPAAGQSPSETSSIIYVDADAIGANDGTSWENAYIDLQPALETSVSGDQVWVAAGMYYPSVPYCGGNSIRYQSFQLKNGVGVYGGFDPSNGDVGWEDRDWVNNLVILSGDIGVVGDNSDNSYHVFCHPDGLNLDASAVLDGFTVRDGNADSLDFPGYYGGGIYNYYSSPTLSNLTFSNNSAGLDGGGMSNISSSPTLANVTFYNNSSSENGGGMANSFSSDPILDNVIFSGNLAKVGGGMNNIYDSSPVLTNVTFSDNKAEYEGGGMTNHNSSPNLTDVTFSGNEAASFGGGMENINSSPILTNVTFFDNLSVDGGGMHNNYASPTLTNVTFSNNTAAVGGEMYNFYYSSPTLKNVTFFGSNDNGVGIYNHTYSSPSLMNCILWGDLSGEIVNANNSNPIVTYSDVQGGYTGAGNLDADPLLGPLQDNGGFVLTHALGLKSQAVDAGNPDPATCPATDARGEPRPYDGDSNGTPRCDMGAYESQYALFLMFLPITVK